MNYQHAYHAGNIADVFKHVILMQLIHFLQKKPAGFCYMETHAAKALYDLNDIASQKTNEYKEGIYQLWQQSNTLHPSIIEYLNIVKKYNLNGELNSYPGSSLIAHHCLREQDEAILCEIHAPVYQALYDYFKQDKKVHVHRGDGYQTLFSSLPPKLKRGLLLIDPPYEAANEYKNLLQALTKMHARWPYGTYAIWFPIKDYQIIKNFYSELKRLPFAEILTCELHTITHDTLDNRLKGSGLMIINPPWQFDALLREILPFLSKIYSAKTHLLWLKSPQ